jgi:hypothetical protein
MHPQLLLPVALIAQMENIQQA